MGREQHIESFGWNWHSAKHVADIFDEPEIEHAVSLVQHDHLYVLQIKQPLFKKIDESTGRAYQHVDAIDQIGLLLLITGTAVYQARSEVQ